MVNSADFVPDIHAQILENMGIPLASDVIATSIGISQTALIKLALQHNGRAATPQDVAQDIAQDIERLIPEFVKREDDIFDDYYADGRIKLKDGLVQLLQGLQQLHIPMAIVSNAYDAVTYKRLRDTGLMGVYFAEGDVFGRARAGTTKPNPHQIILACETMGCSLSETIFFGDTMADRGACDAAGVRMIQIGQSKITPPPFLKATDFMGFAAEIEKLKHAAGFVPPAPQ